jgi:hypothetical protein
MITSYRLYEAEIVFEEHSPDKGEQRMNTVGAGEQDDIVKLINTYSKKPIGVVGLGGPQVLLKPEPRDSRNNVLQQGSTNNL